MNDLVYYLDIAGSYLWIDLFWLTARMESGYILYVRAGRKQPRKVKSFFYILYNNYNKYATCTVYSMYLHKGLLTLFYAFVMFFMFCEWCHLSLKHMFVLESTL